MITNIINFFVPKKSEEIYFVLCLYLFNSDFINFLYLTLKKISSTTKVNNAKYQQVKYSLRFVSGKTAIYRMNCVRVSTVIVRRSFLSDGSLSKQNKMCDS